MAADKVHARRQQLLSPFDDGRFRAAGVGNDASLRQVRRDLFHDTAYGEHRRGDDHHVSFPHGIRGAAGRSIDRAAPLCLATSAPVPVIANDLDAFALG